MGSHYWDDIRRKRITRRRALAAGTMGAAGATLAATVGCGDDDDGGDGTGARSVDPSQLPEHLRNAKYGGTFVASLVDIPQTFDFHTQEPPGSHYIAHPAYSGLIYRIEDTPGHFKELQGELVEKWEQVDETTLVLNVRKGVKWQNVAPVNGREFTGADVKYNIERMRGEHPAGNQVAAEFRMRDMFAPIEKIEVTDDHTVRLKTAFPFAPLLNNLSFSWAQMVARELVEAKGDRNVLSWAVGTGPFILEGFDTLGDGGRIRYKANSDYWKKGQPFFDRLEIPVAAAPETQQARFLNSETDTSFSVDASQTVALRKSRPDIKIIEVPPFYVAKIYFDLANQNSPWAKDKRLRQAMYHFIPYDIILKGLGVECCRAGVMPSNQKPWALDDKELPAAGLALPDAIAKGIGLMAAAGFPPGTEVPLELSIANFYGGNTLGEALVGIFQAMKAQSQGALNINVKLKVIELGDWIKSIYRGGSTYVGSTHADWNYDDPDNTLYRYFHSKGVANNTHIKNQKLDELLDAQRRELNQEKRVATVKDIQRLLLDEAPVVYMVSPANFVAVQPWVENFSPMYLNNVEQPRHFDEWWFNDKAPKRG